MIAPLDSRRVDHDVQPAQQAHRIVKGGFPLFPPGEVGANRMAAKPPFPESGRTGKLLMLHP